MTTHEDKDACKACHGSGTCESCEGTGHFGRREATCETCGGDGICPNCGGTGDAEPARHGNGRSTQKDKD